MVFCIATLQHSFIIPHCDILSKPFLCTTTVRNERPLVLDCQPGQCIQHGCNWFIRCKYFTIPIRIPCFELLCDLGIGVLLCIDSCNTHNQQCNSNPRYERHVLPRWAPMVSTNPGERDKKTIFSPLNLAVYFADTMLTAAFESAYGAKICSPVLIMKSRSPAGALIVTTLARFLSADLRRSGRKTLIVFITPSTLTLNFQLQIELLNDYSSWEWQRTYEIAAILIKKLFITITNKCQNKGRQL